MCHDYSSIAAVQSDGILVIILRIPCRRWIRFPGEDETIWGWFSLFVRFFVCLYYSFQEVLSTGEIWKPEIPVRIQPGAVVWNFEGPIRFVFEGQWLIFFDTGNTAHSLNNYYVSIESVQKFTCIPALAISICRVNIITIIDFITITNFPPTKSKLFDEFHFCFIKLKCLCCRFLFLFLDMLGISVVVVDIIIDMMFVVFHRRWYLLIIRSIFRHKVCVPVYILIRCESLLKSAWFL